MLNIYLLHYLALNQMNTIIILSHPSLSLPLSMPKLSSKKIIGWLQIGNIANGFCHLLSCGFSDGLSGSRELPLG